MVARRCRGPTRSSCARPWPTSWPPSTRPTWPRPAARAGHPGPAAPAPGPAADRCRRRGPQPARDRHGRVVPGPGRPGGRGDRGGRRAGLGAALLRPGGAARARPGRRDRRAGPRGGPPRARGRDLPVPPGRRARLPAHPPSRHPRRHRPGQRPRHRRRELETIRDHPRAAEMVEELAGATTAGWSAPRTCWPELAPATRPLPPHHPRGHPRCHGRHCGGSDERADGATLLSVRTRPADQGVGTAEGRGVTRWHGGWGWAVDRAHGAAILTASGPWSTNRPPDLPAGVRCGSGRGGGPPGWHDAPPA